LDRIVGHDQIRSLWNLENQAAAPPAGDPGPLFHWSHVLSEIQR
jgi:hypothetical protein